MMSWLRRTGVAAVAVVALAGCTSAIRGKQHAAGSTPTSPPSSQQSPNDSPSASASSSASASHLPKVPIQAAIIESHRLGVELAPADTILQQKHTCAIPEGPFPSMTQAAKLVLGDNTDKLLNIGGYVAGWFQCFNVNPAAQQGGVLGVLEAYDEAHAKSLAQVLTLSSSGSANSGTLPGMPDAYVGLYPTADPTNSSINAIVVVGRMLAYVNF